MLVLPRAHVIACARRFLAMFITCAHPVGQLESLGLWHSAQVYEPAELYDIVAKLRVKGFALR
jgi:hypothetical protein